MGKSWSGLEGSPRFVRKCTKSWLAGCSSDRHVTLVPRSNCGVCLSTQIPHESVMWSVINEPFSRTWPAAKGIYCNQKKFNMRGRFNSQMTKMAAVSLFWVTNVCGGRDVMWKGSIVINTFLRRLYCNILERWIIPTYLMYILLLMDPEFVFI